MHGDRFENLRRRYGKSMGKLEKAIKRDGLLRAFYSSYLVPVEVTHLRQLLLGETPFNP